VSTEPRQETTIDGEASGPVLSGTFHSAVHFLQQAKDTELPAELQNINLRKFQLAVADALMHLSDRIETRFRDDDLERITRQKTTDEHREVMTTKLGQIGENMRMVARIALISQILSSVAIGVCIILVLDFGHRMAWW